MARRPRARGSVEVLPSGSRRVKIYAGIDPVTGRRHYLTEIIPAGPTADTDAEKARTRLLSQVDERRNPKTKATFGQLLDRHMATAQLERSTRAGYLSKITNHIRPLLGHIPAGKLDEETLESFYAELRRCRKHCDAKQRGRVEHRAAQPHSCDHRCGPHRCIPLSNSSVLQCHAIISGVLESGVRWKWLSTNPAATARKPPAPKPDPRPPSPADAARLVNEAWRSDPDWGMFVWLAMVTGSRRGELCSVRMFQHVERDNRVVVFEKSQGQLGRQQWEKTTKTHQQRRVVYDEVTAELLDDHIARRMQQAKFTGTQLGGDCFLFSRSVDCSAPLKPDSVTQRYGRMAERLGIDTTLHKLRHYSATELISGGVDVRAVAGRLGHGGGGTTTLRVYTAWWAEADQRGSEALAGRLPARPVVLPPAERAKTAPRSPFERIAAELRSRILDGLLPPGAELPSNEEVAAEHAVAPSTAHRAVDLLRTWGLVAGSGKGNRPRVVDPLPDAEQPVTPGSTELAEGATANPANAGACLLDLEVRRRGETVSRFSTEADPDSGAELRRLLLDAVRRAGGRAEDVGDYEMDVRPAGGQAVPRTFVTTAG